MIQKFETKKFDYENISKLSKVYSEDRFKKEFEDFVDSKLK